MNKTLNTLGSLCLLAISACDPNDQSSGGDDELLNRVASLETKAKEQESRDKDLEAKGKDNTGRLSSNEKDVGQLQAKLAELQSLWEAGSPWAPCGQFTELDDMCELGKYPLLKYEYAMIGLNQPGPVPILCTGWNRGLRIYNRDPYFVESDKPDSGMKRGGMVWYKGTDATDECPGKNWRMRYWFITDKGDSALSGSRGCQDQTIYCRLRR